MHGSGSRFSMPCYLQVLTLPTRSASPQLTSRYYFAGMLRTMKGTAWQDAGKIKLSNGCCSQALSAVWWGLASTRAEWLSAWES
jgi:hypothetical protein